MTRFRHPTLPSVSASASVQGTINKHRGTMKSHGDRRPSADMGVDGATSLEPAAASSGKRAVVLTRREKRTAFPCLSFYFQKAFNRLP
jgi:hypothetical protein